MEAERQKKKGRLSRRGRSVSARIGNTSGGKSRSVSARTNVNTRRSKSMTRTTRRTKRRMRSETLTSRPSSSWLWGQRLRRINWWRRSRPPLSCQRLRTWSWKRTSWLLLVARQSLGRSHHRSHHRCTRNESVHSQFFPSTCFPLMRSDVKEHHCSSYVFLKNAKPVERQMRNERQKTRKKSVACWMFFELQINQHHQMSTFQVCHSQHSSFDGLLVVGQVERRQVERRQVRMVKDKKKWERCILDVFQSLFKLTNLLLISHSQQTSLDGLLVAGQQLLPVTNYHSMLSDKWWKLV